MFSKGGTMGYELELVPIFQKTIKTEFEKKLNQEIEEMREIEARQRLFCKKMYRAGYRQRVIDTVFGSIVLDVPRLREKHHEFSLFKKWQRRTSGLEKSIKGLLDHGMSHSYTNVVVKHVTKINISDHVCKTIKNTSFDEVLKFNEKEIQCPDYVILDATWKGRNMCVLSALGMYTNGKSCSKVLLAFKAYNSESLETWKDFIYRYLMLRGINKENGLKAFICDGMKGIESAIKYYDHEVEILGCLFHLQKNIFEYGRNQGMKRKEVKVFTEEFKKIFYEENNEKALKRYKQVKNQFTGTCYEILLKYVKIRVNKQLRFYRMNQEDHKYIRTISYIERFFKEIKRNLKHWTYFRSLEDLEKAFFMSYRAYERIN